MTVNGNQWLPMALPSVQINCHLLSKCFKKVLNSGCSEQIPPEY